MAQVFVHYSFHLFVPGLLAWVFYRKQWKRAWMVMILALLIDLDHLLAWPDVFVPDRCSIGFHPLHSYYAIGLYVILFVFPKTRLVGLGLLIHILADWQDCLWI